MSNLNREILLWRTTFSLYAYKDQLDISHEGYIVEEEIRVKIVELKQVPNMWGPGTNEGWRAVDKDGKSYFCNWHSYPDEAMTPTYYWTMEDEYPNLVDAEQAIGMRIYVNKDGSKAIPKDFKYCDLHNIWYDSVRNGKCWKCEYFELKNKKENHELHGDLWKEA